MDPEVIKINDNMSLQQEDREVSRAVQDSSTAAAAAAFESNAGSAIQPRNRNRSRRRDLIRAQSPSREPGATTGTSQGTGGGFGMGAGLSGPGAQIGNSPSATRVSPNVTSNLLALSSEASLPTVDFLASTGGGLGGGSGAAMLALSAESFEGGPGGPGSVLYASSRQDDSGNNESKYPLWQN
jgi:hypothetical protein